MLDEAIDLGRTIFGGKKPTDQPDPKSGSGDPGPKALAGLQDLLGGKREVAPRLQARLPANEEGHDST